MSGTLDPMMTNMTAKQVVKANLTLVTLCEAMGLGLGASHAIVTPSPPQILRHFAPQYDMR